MGCMDEWVLAVARHHGRLARRYRLPFPDAAVIERVLDTGRLYVRARALGVPLPRTVEVGPNPDEALEAAGWPVLLKPRDKRGFYDHFGVALFAPETPEEFRRQARGRRALRAAGPGEGAGGRGGPRHPGGLRRPLGPGGRRKLSRT